MSTPAESEPLPYEEFRRICRVMQEYGGSFASALATAGLRADAFNAGRIAAAFPELMTKYGSPQWHRFAPPGEHSA